MSDHDLIQSLMGDLQQKAPAGFALGMHVRFTTPTFLFQTYPKAWLDYYSQNGLLMADPTVAWGMEKTGSIGWENLASADSAGVLTLAAEHGMKYGVTCAIEENGSRSLGSFCREDREFDAAEVEALRDDLAQLHTVMAGKKHLDPGTAAALTNMGIRHPHS